MVKQGRAKTTKENHCNLRVVLPPGGFAIFTQNLRGDPAVWIVRSTFDSPLGLIQCRFYVIESVLLVDFP